MSVSEANTPGRFLSLREKRKGYVATFWISKPSEPKRALPKCQCQWFYRNSVKTRMNVCFHLSCGVSVEGETGTGGFLPEAPKTKLSLCQSPLNSHLIRDNCPIPSHARCFTLLKPPQNPAVVKITQRSTISLIQHYFSQETSGGLRLTPVLLLFWKHFQNSEFLFPAPDYNR